MHYSFLTSGTSDLSNPYVHSVFTLLLIKQIFEKKIIEGCVRKNTHSFDQESPLCKWHFSVFHFWTKTYIQLGSQICVILKIANNKKIDLYWNNNPSAIPILYLCPRRYSCLAHIFCSTGSQFFITIAKSITDVWNNEASLSKIIHIDSWKIKLANFLKFSGMFNSVNFIKLLYF